jgi:hypothetical protein
MHSLFSVSADGVLLFTAVLSSLCPLLKALLTTNTHAAAKNTLRVDALLDPQKAIVVATEERVLPVVLMVALVVVGGCSENLSHVGNESSGRSVLRCSRSLPATKVSRLTLVFCAEVIGTWRYSHDVNKGESVTPGWVNRGLVHVSVQREFQEDYAGSTYRISWNLLSHASNICSNQHIIHLYSVLDSQDLQFCQINGIPPGKPTR